jgi:hypothetical protein
LVRRLTSGLIRRRSWASSSACTRLKNDCDRALRVVAEIDAADTAPAREPE